MKRIIWTEPVALLAAALREEAKAAERTHDTRGAALLLDAAERLEGAIRQGATSEYVDTHAAAEFLDIGEEAVRARCRRRLEREGLARKRGGEWEIHASVLTGERVAA